MLELILPHYQFASNLPRSIEVGCRLMSFLSHLHLPFHHGAPGPLWRVIFFSEHKEKNIKKHTNNAMNIGIRISLATDIPREERNAPVQRRTTCHTMLD